MIANVFIISYVNRKIHWRFTNIQVISKCLNMSSWKFLSPSLFLSRYICKHSYTDINSYINYKKYIMYIKYNILNGIIYKLYKTIIYSPTVYPPKFVVTLSSQFLGQKYLNSPFSLLSYLFLTSKPLKNVTEFNILPGSDFTSIFHYCHPLLAPT